ncbi:MAG: DUF4062 domain-containing protein [Verrucomicrobiota bacterium]
MADFVRKKLQVFVSSTYTDLIAERQAAVSAILSAGHIPAGMELFTAGDESQMDVIKQWIDESDVFVLILGGRYGSLEPLSGKSYTQLEYEYASFQNKPLFACVIQDSAIDEKVKVHGKAAIETLHGTKLARFRKQVLTKLCKFWEDPKDIKISVTETLANIARREDLTGWIRATDQTNPISLLNEMARLSKENAELRVENDRGKDIAQFHGLTFADLKVLLSRNEAMDSLICNRDLLSRGRASKEVVYDELILRGIVRQNPSRFGAYELTEDGRNFLNRYDLESLKLRLT